MRIKTWLASLLLAIMPVAASAVTILPNTTEAIGVNDTAFGQFDPSQTSPVSFSIQANTDMRVDTAATALRVAGFTNLQLMFSKGAAPATDVFAPTMAAGTGAIWALPIVTLLAGEILTVTFMYDAIGAGSGGNASFITSPIPLPAAGWMLISALAGMGLLARRRTTA